MLISTSKELLRRAVEYRQMAILARGHETIRALNTLAVRFALLAAKREIKETSGDEAGDIRIGPADRVGGYPGHLHYPRLSASEPTWASLAVSPRDS
jgi:hypothetical protein